MDRSLDSQPLEMQKKQYAKMVDEVNPRPPLARNVFGAFVIGGLIAVLGQLFLSLFQSWGLNIREAGAAMSATLVFLSALFTGLGIYDEIAKFGGAGTIVPITGFANSMVAPAMEYRAEGLVLGVGARLFTVAGPVLVFGIVAGWLIGLLYYFFR
ncbi:MAG TPA: stage V sporulation protein AC [Desulfotomaculum sp.]|jgi:stage V sporulation protein AC|nr:stage V sporulation protein AC [Desulfotomaculum sp.]